MIPYIENAFVESHTNFQELVAKLKTSFATSEAIVPKRHHHDFPNPTVAAESTMLLMPAWNPGGYAGVKVVTVNPGNPEAGLPSVQGTYIFLDANNGKVVAIIDALSMTAKRTAAASALASTYLSNPDSSSLLMIGTGALSANLIRAHASVRPIKSVFVWGRNFQKAKAVCSVLENETFSAEPIQQINEKLNNVDIVSCATLSATPLIEGKNLRDGQHVDLVGAYRKDMRESDDATITRGSIFLDTFQSGLSESGDIAIPLSQNTIQRSDIQADLFQLCSGESKGRRSTDQITVFKSVGHALEDLAAATYYFEQYQKQQ